MLRSNKRSLASSIMTLIWGRQFTASIMLRKYNYFIAAAVIVTIGTHRCAYVILGKNDYHYSMLIYIIYREFTFDVISLEGAAILAIGRLFAIIDYYVFQFNSDIHLMTLWVSTLIAIRLPNTSRRLMPFRADMIQEKDIDRLAASLL